MNSAIKNKTKKTGAGDDRIYKWWKIDKYQAYHVFRAVNVYVQLNRHALKRWRRNRCMIPWSKLIYPPATTCNSFLHLLSFYIFCFWSLLRLRSLYSTQPTWTPDSLYPNTPFYFLVATHLLRCLGLPYYTPILHLFASCSCSHALSTFSSTRSWYIHSGSPSDFVHLDRTWSWLDFFFIFFLAIERCGVFVVRCVQEIFFSEFVGLFAFLNCHKLHLSPLQTENKRRF